MSNKTLCVFATHNTVHNNILLIRRLAEEIDEVYVASSNSIETIDLPNVIIKVVGNPPGADFIKWYTVLKYLDLKNYSRIYLVNDSCVYVGKLDDFMKFIDKSFNDGYHMCGLTDSYEGMKLNNMKRIYHIQSYFRVMNPTITTMLLNKIDRTKDLIRGSDAYLFVIKYYEVDFCQDVVDAGFKLVSYISVQELFNKKVIPKLDVPTTYYLSTVLPPLIKRKVVDRISVILTDRKGRNVHPSIISNAMIIYNHCKNILDKEGLELLSKYLLDTSKNVK
jgi:hypothetical protein